MRTDKPEEMAEAGSPHSQGASTADARHEPPGLPRRNTLDRLKDAHTPPPGFFAKIRHGVAAFYPELPWVRTAECAWRYCGMLREHLVNRAPSVTGSTPGMERSRPAPPRPALCPAPPRPRPGKVRVTEPAVRTAKPLFTGLCAALAPPLFSALLHGVRRNRIRQVCSALASHVLAPCPFLFSCRDGSSHNMVAGHMGVYPVFCLCLGRHHIAVLCILGFCQAS